MKVHFIVSVVAIAFSLFVAWAAGYDFNQRGSAAVLTIGFVCWVLVAANIMVVMILDFQRRFSGKYDD